MADRSSSGVGFFDLLTLLFVGLKLAGAIDWPWWLVLAPTWGVILLVVVLAAIDSLE